MPSLAGLRRLKHACSHIKFALEIHVAANSSPYPPSTPFHSPCPPSHRPLHSYHGHSLELTFSKDHKTLTGLYRPKPKAKRDLVVVIGSAPLLDESVKMRHPPGLLADARLVGTLKPVSRQGAGASEGGVIQVTGRCAEAGCEDRTP